MIVELLVLSVVLFGCMALRFPVFFCLVLATVVYGLVFPVMPPVVVVQGLTSGLQSPFFVAIPYYFLLGSIMKNGGMSVRLIRLASVLMGGLRGGLSHVNIGSSILFGGFSGSAVADASAVGSVMIPAMREAGYPSSYAAAVTASSATIGLLIPPSIPLVIYGQFNGVSIKDLFIAGLIPGLLMGLYLLLASCFIAHRRNYPSQPVASITEILYVLRDSSLALALPVFTIMAIMYGVGTVIEIGALAVVYAALVSMVVYREINLKGVGRCVVEAAVESVKVLSIIAVSGGILWIIANLQLFDSLDSAMRDLAASPQIMLIIMTMGIVVIGTVISPTLQMILIIPSLVPVASSFGIDLVHFGIVTVLGSSLGMVTPPIGILLFLTAAQAGCPVSAVVKEALPFLCALLALLICLVIFPSLSLGMLRVMT